MLNYQRVQWVGLAKNLGNWWAFEGYQTYEAIGCWRQSQRFFMGHLQWHDHDPTMTRWLYPLVNEEFDNGNIASISSGIYLVGGMEPWNFYDFPETVGNGNIIPTDFIRPSFFGVGSRHQPATKSSNPWVKQCYVRGRPQDNPSGFPGSPYNGW